MEILLTVLSGTCVFVCSQVFLKFFIDPIISFKEAIGNICHIFLSNQADIVNALASDILVQEIKTASGILLSKKQAIPLYKITSCLSGLPQEHDVLVACACLNKISVKVKAADENDNSCRYDKINTLMEKIESTLKVTLSYKIDRIC